ncbi:hypothetical protein KU306_11290 [Haloferax larsenii]|uniref:Restriction endonuclease BglII n=1 Tax=Haloferax larsenii TaxID=302484 RepID=A0ABY5RD35_HALLR|nr:hypothetical protein [Haloferax larsenii]UVE49500.1 hypothetical protein KU306_11290 [Haloferax larsenii]
MNSPRTILTQLLCNDPDEHVQSFADREPSEKLIVDSLATTVAERDDIWAETEVNLWQKKAQSEGDLIEPQRALREFSHPLQPDIDILCGSINAGQRNPPLIGIEAKYFGQYTGIEGDRLLPKRVGPEGNPIGGFYSGLGQALSLLSMGLDYVYLWHVFELREDIFVDSKSESGQLDTETIANHRDIVRTYTTEIKNLLDTYDLPIGYFAHGLVPAYDNRLLVLDARPLLDCEPIPRNHNKAVRSLLVESMLSESW